MTSPARTAQLVYGLPSSAFNEPAPGKTPYYSPGLDGNGQQPGGEGLPERGSADLMDALKKLHEAQAAYQQAERFYDGDAGDLHTNPRVAELLARAGATEVDDFNYAKVPVDSVADNLIVRAVTTSSGEQAEQDDEHNAAVEQVTERAQEVLDELRKTNQLDAEEQVLHHLVSKHGDAYLFVWPETDEDALPDVDPADELDLPDEQYPSRITSVNMWVNDACSVRIFYDPENPLRAIYAIKSWEWLPPGEDKPRVRATLYYQDRIEKWVSEPEEDKEKPESWVPYLQEAGEQWPIENPTGRIPFFHFRTKRQYGLPEHISAYGPQRLINKLIISHAGTIDFQSFPQRYILLSPKAEQLLLNLADPDYPEDIDTDPEGDGYSQFRADPSAVWQIPGGAGAGQFAAADPGVFMDPLDRYIKSMAELTKTPLDEFVGNGQGLSGEARRYGRKPLTDKLRNRSKAYGAEWQDAYEFALGLLGFSDVTVNVEWAPFETASGLEDWNAVGVKIANGVPVSQVLQEAGYERDVVESWLSDETGADLMRRVALLNSIGTAVQALGAGVGLGVVSAPQVADIISRILGLTAEALPMLDQPVEIEQKPPMPPPGFGPPEGEDGPQPGPAGPDGVPLPPMPPPPPPIQVGRGSANPDRS